MQNKSTLILGILGALILIIIFSSAYVVNEKEQVIITRFGKPVYDPITTPGIKFKIPFFDTINRFEKRFLEWDGDPNQVPTKDKRFIWVDTYARWRIVDPLLFFQRLRDERGAISRLDDILDGETRTAIAKHNLNEVVRSTNREPALDDTFGFLEELDSLVTIKRGRKNIMKDMLAESSERVKDLGIEILDIRFKRIDYIEEDRIKVYDRMITERKRIAEKFRSEGQGEASIIRGQKERELKKITSQAFRTAEEIKGRGDATATRVYANAYNRNEETREFYRFLKTMETYESTFSADDWLILSSDNDFYKYLQNQRGR